MSRVPRRRVPRTAFLVTVAWTLLALLTSTAAGAREHRRNFIGGEVVGRNILSLNYERMLTSRFGLGGGIGLGGYAFVSSLSGDTHSLYLSVGGAMIPAIFLGLDPTWLMQGSVGYQYQPSGGFFVRPLLSVNRRFGGTPGIFALPGVTFGVNF